jgi:hypothetical protein
MLPYDKYPIPQRKPLPRIIRDRRIHRRRQQLRQGDRYL